MTRAISSISPLEFSKVLLEKKVVKAVLGLKRLNGKAFPALMARKEDLEGFDPLFPIMSSNMARSVSRLTLLEPLKDTVVVFLRPCELRATFELVKLNQVNLDNLIFVGVECLGVVENRIFFVRLMGDEVYSNYIDAIREGREPENLRRVCYNCEYMYPEGADIVLSCVGRDKPVFIGLSDKGREIMDSFGTSSVEDVPLRTEMFDRLQEERRKRAKDFYNNIKERCSGIDGLLEVFGRCIGCHNCSRVCPICYCKDCFFESVTFDYEPIVYENKLLTKGSLRIPMDVLLFQLGRMTHMSFSCVSCGMCEDACPMEIPVSQIFKTVGKDVQELFGYVPGRSLEEPLPMTTFNYDELHEVEDR
ncbi:MAG: 4Fe-4S dicluster domain-containing protein [Thermosulfidibacteraceae bacterium]